MSKAKFKVGDVVVVTSMYPDGDNKQFDDKEVVIGNQYTIKKVYESYGHSWCPSPFVYYLQDCDAIMDESMITLASEYNKPKAFCLDNTKIDVAQYAAQYGLTLEQAHNEIQPWLFEQGYDWTGVKNVKYFDKSYLFFSYGDVITWDNTPAYFDRHEYKQIFLNRNTNVVLTIKEPVAMITYDRKVYNKEEFEKAISNLKQLVN